ncbi:hypothetical protein [Serratia marcescens]|uniref:hypothetical protein n=1 Tax=Serratia marcescens TaxID=615 RepID=UPI00137907D9|nr:hypothetical protein [Serratia marcescens]NCI84825.1 hypothetical protein [Serratia marcescens]NDI95892.1 hypothetical protein [Serratia marcescens]NDJ65009.1 hypothetical protein [Serratia marcescens]HAT3781501.1 hypothetical protein [Serratia marcescens]HAT3850616.1 hypothetical protein [Serratia marcescens]
MKILYIVILYILSFISTYSYATMEYKILCPGENRMIVARSNYNLSTMLSSDGFYVAIGQRKFTDYPEGDLKMTQFQNGKIIVSNENLSIVYLAKKHGRKLEKCTRESSRYIPPITPKQIIE